MTISPTHSRALDSCSHSSFVALYMYTIWTFIYVPYNTSTQNTLTKQMISCNIYIDKPLGLLAMPFWEMIYSLSRRADFLRAMAMACFSLPRSAICTRELRERVSRDIFLVLSVLVLAIKARRKHSVYEELHFVFLVIGPMAKFDLGSYLVTW